MRNREPTCWWCDDPARRAPLVERYGVHFHRGACLKAFHAANPLHANPVPVVRPGRRPGEDLAPMRRHRAA